MIIFELQCEAGHRFEGWFGDSQDYEQQKQQGLLTCPMCDGHNVSKMPGVVPFIKKSTRQPSSEQQQQIETKSKSDSKAINKKRRRRRKQEVNVDPVVLLKTLHHHVRTKFENVGSRFYDEVVKMHRGESPKRGIYGHVTHEQQEKLDEQEIPYATLPKLGPEFEN